MFAILLKNFKRLTEVSSAKKSFGLRPNRRISYLLAKLSERQVIDVEGNDSYDYIQGLINDCNSSLILILGAGLVTNDIRHLCPTRETSVCYDCINSFMLNTIGRVITDVFIYKYDQDFEDKKIKHLLLEMDSQISPKITNFLKAYRIRRKVNIQLRNNLEVWSLFPSVDHFDNTFEKISEIELNFDDLKSKNIVVVKDPRLRQMGYRFLVPSAKNGQNKEEIINFLNSNSLEFSETDAEDYHKFRYRLGVGEGVRDFPVESCFPLECNGDFLHAISFQKG